MIVYHYCSMDIFKSILNSKKLWITPIDCVNDSKEMIHLYEFTWKKVKIKLFQNDINIYSPMFGYLESKIEKVDKFTYKPYLCCFSKEGDLLSQWRAYGDNGYGVSIGFNLEDMKVKNELPHPNVRLENAIGISNVIYDYEKQINILLSIINQKLKDMKNNALDWLQLSINLKHYSGIFKNRSFFEEKEVRIIYYPSQDHSYSETHINGPFSYEENFDRYEINWYKNFNNNLIEEIVIGPNCNLSRNEIVQIANENNVNISKIRYSESSYRD